MTEWNYGDPRWREHAGDPQWLMREALRRAVDLRDRGIDSPVGPRPVMLVDVLNALSHALGYETSGNIWSDFDSPG